ncbi:MAG: type II secretion system protein N [Psychromonas sp.]
MKIKLILLFVFFYLGSLITTIPASLITYFVPKNSGVEMSTPSGTLWNGKTTQITYDKKYNLQQVSWKVDWSALLSLQVKLDLKFANASEALSGNGSFLYGLNGPLLENVFIDLPAAQLLTYANLPLPVEVNGDISLVLKKASQGAPYCAQLDAFIVWDNASINSQMGNVDLASANIDVSCENGEIFAVSQQQSEQIETSFNASLRKAGAYQLKGLMKGTDKLDPSINQSLSWIGKKDNTGATMVSIDGYL